MFSLLTFNGVPPRVIGSLTAQQREQIITYPWLDQGWQKISADGTAALTAPFTAFAARSAAAFTAWGACILEQPTVTMRVDDLETNTTTFNGPDRQLHADMNCFSWPDLHEKNILNLRLLCVSSMPATFIDLTDDAAFNHILESHKTELDSRFFKPSLLKMAKLTGHTLCPRKWEVVLFDSVTPHKPAVAKTPHRRFFQQSWTKVMLPPDWKQRLAGGDAPRMSLASPHKKLAFFGKILLETAPGPAPLEAGLKI